MRILILFVIICLVPVPSRATAIAELGYVDHVQMACTVLGRGPVDLDRTMLCTAAHEALVAGHIDSRVKQVDAWANIGPACFEKCRKGIESSGSPEFCDGLACELSYPDVQLPISMVDVDHIVLTEERVLTVVVTVAWHGNAAGLSSKIILPKRRNVPARTIELPDSVDVEASQLMTDVLRANLEFIFAHFFSTFEVNAMMYIVNCRKSH